MDERGRWDPVSGPTEPDDTPARLTRRELRARAEAGRSDEETEPREEADGAARDAPEVVPETQAGPETAEVPDAEPTRWSEDVDLTVELPRTPPEDPEIDDVRWDGPFPPVGHVPRGPAQWPAGPLREDVSGVRPFAPLGQRGAPTEADGTETEDGAGAATSTAGDRQVSTAAGADPRTDSSTSTGTGSETGTEADPGASRPAGPDPRRGGPALPTGGPVEPNGASVLPTLDDLLATRREPADGPAQGGWQATVRRLTGGLVAPGPGTAERRHRDAVARVQRSLDGPRTVVVINPKGGAQKTTATLLIAATFGLHRGGYTLAWDNNETRGTLGWRSEQARHHNTAVTLLQDLEHFADPATASVGDLDPYVRAQGSARFDVLASDEDAASAASIDAFAFRALHRTLSRFYRVMVVDTGNNMRASNWQAALEAADQVVLVSTVREDTAQSGAWALDALRATGHADAVSRAVTVLASPAPKRDEALAGRLHEHFGRLTRAVLDVPYDPTLVAGGPVDFGALSAASREAWLRVTATVADGL